MARSWKSGVETVHSVVALTGLVGKAFASWQAQDGTMWLRDALPNDVKSVRTHIYGYVSTLQRSLSAARLIDYTKGFAFGLRNYLDLGTITVSNFEPVNDI